MATTGRLAGGQKTGGRQKGSDNKLTAEARRIFNETLEMQVPFINDAFNKVREEDPAKYLELFAKYAQYFVPKKVEINDGKSVNIPVTAWIGKDEPSTDLPADLLNK